MTLRQQIGLETDCGWVPDAERVEAYLEKKLVSFCDDMHRAAKDCYENAASELDTSKMVESVWHNFIATEAEESTGISAEAILDLALTVNDEAAIENGMRRRFGMVLFKETAGS